MAGKKRHYLIGVILLGVTVVFLALAIFFQKDLRQAFSPNIDKSDAKAVCTSAEKPDMNWRWYTKNYPAPSVKWQIFTTDHSLCLRINKRWKMYAINRKKVKRYGCFDTHSGLFCMAKADPYKYPDSNEFIN